nr:unnamed protein product [Callosobruchus chinensis]
MPIDEFPTVDPDEDLTQLSSIPGLDEDEKCSSSTVAEKNETVSLEEISEVDTQDDKIESDPANVETRTVNVEPEGIKAKDDPRYSKFFKMLHVGVPEPAVKLKMRNEGVDPNILE